MVSLIALPTLISAALGATSTAATVFLFCCVIAYTAFTAFAVRCAACGVMVRRGRVVIRNPLSTTTVSTSDVARAELRPVAFYPGIAFLVLRDGRELRAWGIQASQASPRAAQELVDSINRFLLDGGLDP
ncbi:PH domain-containing protein [Svornostia abyssi]|uniref:PH domain-containing protein n=1 Tax=Svornostia abyssi TaxID=2898438 RepID=A0ABY5PHD0_9ACTN|nr:PH domain-containing protein [Parviterribacteraceae bacterium J379]